MATIYDLATGRIISENSDVTTIKDHADLPECSAALRPAQRACTPAQQAPVDEYMCLIQELLKKL